MRHSVRILLAASLVLGAVHAARGADPLEELFDKARAALTRGQNDEALALANKAVAAAPKDYRPFLFRGSLYETMRKHNDAVADYDKAIAIEPDAAEAYNR